MPGSVANRPHSISRIHGRSYGKTFYGHLCLDSNYDEFSRHERSGSGNDWWKACSFGKLIVITTQILLLLYFFFFDATTIQSGPSHPK